MRIFLSLLIASIVLLSCKKLKAHKLSGTYDCEIRTYSWILGEVPTETTTHGELVVEKNGTTINVLNREIEVSEIEDGEELAVSGYPVIFEIKFSGDSVYCYSYSGGHGGGSGTNYKGLKM
jgi:hypothetical protein